MSEFRGEHTVKLDDKGRLIFPSPLKGQAASDSDGRYIVKKHIHLNCLEICPIEEWKIEMEKIKKRLNMNIAKHALLWSEYNRNTAEITPDEKTGRISVPKQLLEMIGIEKEVVFVGLGDTINLWAKNVYEGSVMGGDDLASLVEDILGNEAE